MTPLLLKAQALKAVVSGALLLAAVVGIYQFGRHVKTAEIAEEKLQVATATAAQVEVRQEKADVLIAENTTRRAKQAPKDRIITKEIIRYVDVTPPDQRCALPGTWRLRHDAAATGVPTAAETGSVALGTAGEVEDATAIEVVGENYALARECADKLAAWQRRYRDLEQ